MVAVKKDAVTGTITPRHTAVEVSPSSSGRHLPASEPQPAPSGPVREKETRLSKRPAEYPSPLNPNQGTSNRENSSPVAGRRERKGRISLDDLFKQATRLSQLHKPHKANDAGWEAIESVRKRDGELGLNHFKLLKRLGCGDIGSVYLTELRDTKARFAMKVMDLGSLASRRKQMRAETERDILSILDHPFLPTLYAHFETPQFLCLVMEFCSGGDLHTLRQKQASRVFNLKSARFYAAEILLALEYLHMMGVVYRDLKPENVLVRGDGHVMLSDFDLSLKCSVSPTLLTHGIDGTQTVFRDETGADDDGPCYQRTSCLPRNRARRASMGFSTTVDLTNLRFAKPSPTSKWKPRIAKSKSSSKIFHRVSPLPELVAEPTGVRSMSFVGTHEYLAPEIIAGDGHGSAVDWWTFGIFLYELLYGKTPFKGEENEITLVNVLAQPLEFPPKGDLYYQEVDVCAKELIKALLVKDPQKRLGFRRGATEVKQHSFFEGINWALIRCTLPPQIPRPSIIHKRQENGLLPPSKLTISPPAKQSEDQLKRTYNGAGDSHERSTNVRFEYF